MMEENDGCSVPRHRRTITLPNGNHSSPYSSPSPSSSDGSTFELTSPKSPTSASYTSLRDLLPTSPSSLLSPTPPAAAATAAAAASFASSAADSASEISIPIRNRLVKQAAWAYLQPTFSSSPSSPRRIYLTGEFLRQNFAGFRKFIADAVSRVYDWLVDALWLILCR